MTLLTLSRWFQPRTGSFGLRVLPLPHLRSITSRNLLLFLAIYVVATAPLAWFYLQDVRRGHIGTMAAHLGWVAEKAAARFDARLVEGLASHSPFGEAGHPKLVALLQGIQNDFGVHHAALLLRAEGHRFAILADGNDRAPVGSMEPLLERFPESAAAAVRAWEGAGSAHTGLFGAERDYMQLAKPLRLDGQVVALLVLNERAGEVERAIRIDTAKLLALTLALFVVGALGFRAVSKRMLRPLGELEAAAQRVAAGSLDIEIRPPQGSDELAQLSRSFQAMVLSLRQSRAALVQGHEELARTLSRVRVMEGLERSLLKFVPRTVRSALSNDPAALERAKTERDVTVLFLDIEGSTVLAEAMEMAQMDRLIEVYFSRFLDCIYENQGDVTETAGDGLMIIFQGDDPVRHALNAAHAAAAIQVTTERMRRSDTERGNRVRINLGLNSGPALVGFSQLHSVSGSRVTFTASGRTTILAARLQQLAVNGSVLLSEETARRIRGHAELHERGMRLQSLGPHQLKNLHRPEQVHRLVLSAADPAAAASARTPSP